jgi:lysophospholipase L1-like esterase
MYRTQTFLEQQGYSYAFMSYVNYWTNTDQYVSDMDKSLTYYAGHTTVYQKVKQAPWIWADSAQNGLYEFAKNRKMLESDNFHPSATAHQQFAEQVIIPYIERHIL